jgi:LuxR family transcriptional regulator/LuxR family quorum-sensing system transcriptional regulator CciR
MTLDDFSRAVVAAPTQIALWRVMQAFCRERGIRRLSYHHYPPGAAAQDGLTLRADGYPEDWVCRYLDAHLYRIDPIPALALSQGTPFLWSQAADPATPDPDAARYLAILARARLGDGLAMPVYGPGGRNGYVGMGFGGPAPDLSPGRLTELQAAAQIAHLSYCARVSAAAFTASRSLSPREREVLDWIARGKSNAAIAVIMGLSRHTVGTHVRRLFAKLGVNDRVSAALRGTGGSALPVTARRM